MPHAWPARVSTVLFDVGNTLHHLDHGYIADAISRRGPGLTAHEVAVAEYTAKAAVDARFRARDDGSDAGDDAGRRLGYFETILQALHVPAHAWPDIIADLHAEDQRECLWRVMQVSTPRVLHVLRERGYTLGIVSNADGRVAASLAEKGTAEYFAAVVDSYVVGVEKPDARIFALALEGCAASPEESIFVGDIYEIDVRGARNAGITPVLLDPLNAYGPVDCQRLAALDELLTLLPPR
jgi:HAD superfamily hydrolase (TIGR01549 family)